MSSVSGPLPWWWWIVIGVIPYVLLVALTYGSFRLARRRSPRAGIAFLVAAGFLFASGFIIARTTWQTSSFDGRGEEIGWSLALLGLATATAPLVETARTRIRRSRGP